MYENAKHPFLYISSSSSSSGVPPNFTEDSGGDECLLVRKIGEYERQRVCQLVKNLTSI